MNNATLFLADQASVYERVSGVLEDLGYEVSRMIKVSGAVKLLEEKAFRYIFVTYPVADFTIDGFLKAVRARNSTSRHAGVVILASPSSIAEVEKFVDSGANRVLSFDASDDEIQRVLDQLRSVAPRASAQAMLKFTLDVGGKLNRVMSQTENLSSTGMRIRGPQSYPLGTKFDFELALPGKPQPITGVAVLVRHTRWPVEPVEGFGAQFLEIDADGRRQLEAFLQSAEFERGE